MRTDRLDSAFLQPTVRRVSAKDASTSRGNEGAQGTTQSMSWAFLLLLIASVLLLSTVTSGSGASHEAWQNKHQESADEKTQTAKPLRPEPSVPLRDFQAAQAATLDALRALHAEQEARAKEKRPQYEPFSAPSNLISLGLLIAAVVYSVFAWEQWAAISQGTKVANRTLLLQFRPRLIVRHVGLLTEPDDMLVANEAGALRPVPIEAILIVTNQGGTQAEIVEGKITLRVLGGDSGLEEMLYPKPLLPQFDKHTGLPVYGDDPLQLTQRIIRAGERQIIKQTMAIADTVADDVRGYLATHPTRNVEHMALVAYGYFRYRDRVERSYTTAFCRRYDRAEQRFVVVEEPDYENTD